MSPGYTPIVQARWSADPRALGLLTIRSLSKTGTRSADHGRGTLLDMDWQLNISARTPGLERSTQSVSTLNDSLARYLDEGVPTH